MRTVSRTRRSPSQMAASSPADAPPTPTRSPRWMASHLPAAFSHMGGKAKLTRYLLPLIPPHVCYVEPFAGAASLFFNKEPSLIEVLNDSNGDLINFFRVLRDRPWELVARLLWQPYSRAASRAAVIEGDPLERAAVWFFLKQGSFGGQGPGNGLATSVVSQNCARGFARKVEGLASLAYRLRDATIEDLDAVEIIKRYDRPTTFFYCDPPYVNGTGRWPEEEHRRLAAALASLKGKALLNYYEAPLVRELYAGWRIDEIAQPARHVEGRNGPRPRESLLAIRNYD